MEMPQIGNLAIICAERRDAVMQIVDGQGILFVGDGLDKRQFTIDCRDNAGISKLIYELNHGSLRKEAVCNERR